MKSLLRKILFRKLKELDKCDYKELELDKRSFESGYSNGFIAGFSVIQNWIMWLLIILTISLIFNFI